MSEQPTPDFADGKEAGAFRTIGEIAQAFGIKQHVLRYWEEQFPMLKPLKRAGGRRYYRPDDVRLIAEINRLLYTEGFTIRGARQTLAGRGTTPAPDGATPDRSRSDPQRPEVSANAQSPNGANAQSPNDTAAKLRAVRAGLSQALQHS